MLSKRKLYTLPYRPGSNTFDGVGAKRNTPSNDEFFFEFVKRGCPGRVHVFAAQTGDPFCWHLKNRKYNRRIFAQEYKSGNEGFGATSSNSFYDDQLWKIEYIDSNIRIINVQSGRVLFAADTGDGETDMGAASPYGRRDTDQFWTLRCSVKSAESKTAPTPSPTPIPTPMPSEATAVTSYDNGIPPLNTFCASQPGTLLTFKNYESHRYLYTAPTQGITGDGVGAAYGALARTDVMFSMLALKCPDKIHEDAASTSDTRCWFIINHFNRRRLYALDDGSERDGFGATSGSHFTIHQMWKCEEIHGPHYRMVNAGSGRVLYAQKDQNGEVGMGASRSSYKALNQVWSAVCRHPIGLSTDGVPTQIAAAPPPPSPQPTKAPTNAPISVPTNENNLELCQEFFPCGEKKAQFCHLKSNLGGTDTTECLEVLAVHEDPTSFVCGPCDIIGVDEAEADESENEEEDEGENEEEDEGENGDHEEGTEYETYLWVDHDPEYKARKFVPPNPLLNIKTSADDTLGDNGR